MDRKTIIETFAGDALNADHFFSICANDLGTFSSLVDGDSDILAEMIAANMAQDDELAKVIHKAQNIYLGTQILDSEN